MKKLRIGILGTRGIPNHYGGYEQAATYLSVGLVQKGHEVTVYNSHNHPFRENNWNGVEIIRCYDPEKKTGTAGQFIYDLNCIRHARKRNYDVLLLLGYTSSSVWGRFYPSRTVIISNMDGLEWKRSKYSMPVRQYLRYAEKWAVQYSDHFIADSPVIREYLREKYSIDSRFIPYGAELNDQVDEKYLQPLKLEANGYYLLIARMEPENNIETILDGYVLSGSSLPFLVIGNTANKYGKRLQRKFARQKAILFAGSIFDQSMLNSLRFYAALYFHGHSVGGTNPSLLEAMASKCLIVAHNNSFNRAVLGGDANYFLSAGEVADRILANNDSDSKNEMICNNLAKIKEQYNWTTITEQYNDFILECCNSRTK